jgi:integrase/recombinase XerD
MPTKGTITLQTPLVPAMKAWESFLYDQGRSPNTVKAFFRMWDCCPASCPRTAVGGVTTSDLNRFFHWMETERDVSQPQDSLRRIADQGLLG